MKKDNLEAVRAFMKATEKLGQTNQTMEDIYNTIVERDPDAWCAMYFDESGKFLHTGAENHELINRRVEVGKEFFRAVKNLDMDF